MSKSITEIPIKLTERRKPITKCLSDKSIYISDTNQSDRLRSQSLLNITTSTDCIFKISESHLSSSEESIKRKFYQTLKKISTTQNLDVEQQTPGRSPTLIIVKPVYKI